MGLGRATHNAGSPAAHEQSVSRIWHEDVTASRRDATRRVNTVVHISPTTHLTSLPRVDPIVPVERRQGRIQRRHDGNAVDDRSRRIRMHGRRVRHFVVRLSKCA
jgi:hypothetical protein